jgi:phosphate transport system permease protein
MLFPLRSPSTRRRFDGLSSISAILSVIIVFAMFTWITVDLMIRGFGRLSPEFLTLPVMDAGRAGGIGPVLVSTALLLGVAMSAALPVALLAAVLLSEFGPAVPRLATFIRRSVDVLAGVPSIVFGLFGSAFFCITLKMGFSILSGGLTLACMALPLVIRTVEEGLRGLPDAYRLGPAALGLPRTWALRHILLPIAMPALVSGFVLGVGRAAAETAALIFTSGYVDRWPESLLDSGRSLSVHVYDLSMNVPGGESAAAASALVLLVLLLVINSAATQLQRRWSRRRGFAP